MKFGTDNTGAEVFSLTLLGLFYSLEFLRICSFLVSYLDIEEKKWCKYSWHFIFINKDKS